MALAFVDKLASQNNGVKYLLVAVDIFLRFVRVHTMKTKNATDTLLAFKKVFSRKTIFFKYCKEKDIEVHSTMSETKSAFAETVIQSFKHIICRYIVDHAAKKNVFKLQQFVSTLNCRKNRSIGKSPRDVKNNDSLSICIINRS